MLYGRARQRAQKGIRTMNWFMSFLANPVRSLLLTLGVIVAGVVLLFAIAHSPHGLSVLGVVLATIPLLVLIRVPMRVVMKLAVLAVVIVGVVCLFAELVASGVLALLMLVIGVLALGWTLRWINTARQGLPPVRRHRIGRW
jgi:membrane-bound ClpP family serine protease